MIGFKGGDNTHHSQKLLAANIFNMPPGILLAHRSTDGLWLVQLVTHSSSRQELTERCGRARSIPLSVSVVFTISGLICVSQTSLPPVHTAVTQNYCVCGKFEFYALVCRKEPQKLDTRSCNWNPESGTVVNHQARIIWNNCDLTPVWCTPFHLVATHFKVGINNWSSQ